MGWLYLFVAGLLEIFWAIGLKYSDGFTQMKASVATVAGMIFSFVFLSKALETLPLGTGYAVWTGIGAVGTAVLGLILFNEPRNLGRILSLVLIIIGIVGLRLTAED